MAKYFVIQSYGRTATFWLAAMLNLHPDIICTHGSGFPAEIPRINKSKQHETESIFEGALNNIRKPYIDEYFNDLNERFEAKLFGNVHGYSYSDVATNVRKSKHEYVFYNIVRHPIPRIQSFVNKLYEIGSKTPSVKIVLKNEYNSNPLHHDMVDAVLKKYKVEFEYPLNFLFISSMLYVLYDVKYIKFPIIHIHMERLTSDKKYFCDFFEQLVSGKLPISDDYIKKIFSLGKLNTSESNNYTNMQIYEHWKPWQQYLFKLLMDQYNFPKLYERFSYDFSYVR